MTQQWLENTDLPYLERKEGLEVWFINRSRRSTKQNTLCSTSQAVSTRISGAPPCGRLQYNPQLKDVWVLYIRRDSLDFNGEFCSAPVAISDFCKRPQLKTWLVLCFVVTIWCIGFNLPPWHKGAACVVLDPWRKKVGMLRLSLDSRYKGYRLLLGQCHSSHAHTHTHGWQLACTACLADPEAERRPSR